MSKKIKLIPLEENAEHFLNIVPASKFIPEWYRKSSSKINGMNTELATHSPGKTTSTYKKCTPFYDAMTAGYMVYLSADIEITRTVDNMPYIMWRTNRKIVTDHSLDQWEGLPCPTGYSSYVYKWHNQFTIKTPSDYSMLFVSPINRFDLPFITITGLVDTDTYDLSVHFPFFIRDDFSGIIKKGTPITQIIPIKRDSWQIDNEKYNKNKTEINMEKFKSTIKRSYKNNYWFMKDYQ